MHRHYSFILHVHIITFAKHLISACLIQELCHCVIDALTVTPVFIIFQAIAKLQQGNIGNTKMPCALMMDEMAIRKQLDFDRSADKFVMSIWGCLYMTWLAYQLPKRHLC